MWTAGGKTILKPIEYLIGWLLAFLAPNYLSNSRNYGFPNYTSPQYLQIWSKSVDVEKCPLSVPPGEK